MYRCEICNYSTDRSNNLSRHDKSKKHMKNMNLITDSNLTDSVNVNKNVDIEQKNNQNNDLKKYICLCGKHFSHRQSLWMHKKKCKNQKIILTFLKILQIIIQQIIQQIIQTIQ